MSVHMLEALIGQYKTCEVSGEGNLTYVSAANCVTPEIIIYGKCMQSGTPSPNAPVTIEYNKNNYNFDSTIITAPNLYAVGNVRDEYYPLTGKIVRKCRTMTVSSSVEFVDATNETRGICFRFAVDNVSAGHYTSLCSHFINVSGTWANSHKGKIGEYSDNDVTGYKYFRPPNESIDNLDKFKAWLDDQKETGTPVILVYQLDKPVTEYTAPIQICSARGINTIVENGNVPGPGLCVKYLAHS